MKILICIPKQIQGGQSRSSFRIQLKLRIWHGLKKTKELKKKLYLLTWMIIIRVKKIIIHYLVQYNTICLNTFLARLRIICFNLCTIQFQFFAVFLYMYIASNININKNINSPIHTRVHLQIPHSAPVIVITSGYSIWSQLLLLLRHSPHHHRYNKIAETFRWAPHDFTHRQ